MSRARFATKTEPAVVEPAPAAPCRMCGSRRFFLAFTVWICTRCHPPVNAPERTHEVPA